jgi:hypothetical protein
MTNQKAETTATQSSWTWEATDCDGYGGYAEVVLDAHGRPSVVYLAELEAAEGAFLSDDVRALAAMLVAAADAVDALNATEPK